MVTHIKVRGAREHNLKNVSVDIPKNSLTVITGLSGSGKSSLAFDTIYAEGNRRFVESLSAYARQFLNLSNKPEVDSIEGLSPAIAIEQKTTSKNPRSTVGTITEIYDYLRVLYAQAGTAYCPEHNIPIKGQDIAQMIDRIFQWPEGTRLQVLAPIVRGRKGEYKKELQELSKKGFARIRINGEVHDIADAPDLDKNYKHNIEVVVDRLALREDNTSRLTESLESALLLADGLAQVEAVARGDDELPEEVSKPLIFSEKHACPECGWTLQSLEPRLFSFNSPFGACSECDGLGSKWHFDPERIIPDPSLSLKNGAIEPWGKTLSPTQLQLLKGLGKHYGFDINMTFAGLPEKAKKVLMEGSGREKIAITYDDGFKKQKTEQKFEGIIPALTKRWANSNPWKRDDLVQYRVNSTCACCNGQRLNEQALAVRVDGKTISDVCDLSIQDAKNHFGALLPKLPKKEQAIATPVMKEVTSRLGFLHSVGLDYLTMNRVAGTLSGGESQRIRLASQIGSGLTGVMYVLDEPSIGLHQRDNDRLLKTLFKLKELDNTVIVVEHDEDAIRAADHVIDMGPRAGEHGGQVMVEGTIEDIKKSKNSITGQYMRGEKEISVPKERRKVDKEKLITIKGATANNLKGIDASFPVGLMTCVTGVSGGGKSSLVMETLHKGTDKILNKAKDLPGAHKSITGVEHIDKVINIDQSPIGRTPRSNPATYTGILGPIRDWFAQLPEARQRGYKPGRFSFNVKGGRCESCQGDGLVKIEMHFLPDVYVECDVCKGARYNRETLEVKYKGKSMADVLGMTVEEALEFFYDIPTLKNRLQTLMDVGLSYIRLGQSATTLSGGEAQRIKLAKELSKRATGKTLYILDEPTTGLHFEDINMLLKVLHRLVNEGNTMVIIEHNLDVIKTADYLIDIGPEGGVGGGELIATGTPEELVKVENSYTGYFLKPMLK